MGQRAGQCRFWPSAPCPGPPEVAGRRAGSVSVSVTDRALALRPGAGPPVCGGAGGFPAGAPDAAAAAAAAAASSSLPPKLVMNVIFSSRPGVGERERERDSELDSVGDLQSREGAQCPVPSAQAPGRPPAEDARCRAAEREQRGGQHPPGSDAQLASLYERVGEGVTEPFA